MQIKNVLKNLDIGNSVAEFDDALENYFVETETFHSLISGKFDVIAGDKGTGKTALFKILERRYRQFDELRDVELITAFNPAGNPVFQRLVHEDPLTEGQYRSVWKAYFLSLAGNWLLNIAEPDYSDELAALDDLLERVGLRADDDSPQTIFGKIINSLRRFLHPESAEVEFSVSETGLPIVTPRINFRDKKAPSPQKRDEISHEDAFKLLGKCLDQLQVTVWIALDRLDEAFQGFPAIEVPALRALLRTYLDVQDMERLRLKLFVRRDLFRKIVKGGFVNLTHVNARKTEIIWDEDDLLNLLCERIKENGEFLREVGALEASNEELFYNIFPDQVDVGERKPTTWNWIISRVRDGNHVKPPRNLLDMVMKAREAQLRREDREPREYQSGADIIEADSFKRALKRLSEERVEDTLLAEAGEAVAFIEKFRNEKSEQNKESLSEMLSLKGTELDEAIRVLKEFGFLEEIGQNFKIPMLYRDGLQMVQGKGF